MTDRLFLGHTTTIAQASIERPNDTTPYAAGDVIGDAAGHCVIEFPAVARSNGGSGMIMSAAVVDSANQATQPSLELWLFTTPPANVADNAPLALTDAEMATWIGTITLSSARVSNAGAGASGNLVIESDVIAKPVKCGGGSASLYGIFVVRNAYTPVASESFAARLAVLQDY